MTKKKILIVEDDADVRRGLHIRLTANGYETFFAADALSSVSEARKNRPDLILLDLGLPAGDGFLVMQRLQAITNLAVIPIVVLSARDRHANEGRALESGARAFLQKPVDNEVLIRTLREILEENPV